MSQNLASRTIPFFPLGVGVATLSPSSTTSGDTAPYSPSADSSSSSSDCSSSPDAPSPPRLVPIFKKKQPPSPSLPTSTSIMTAVSAVSAVLAAADHKQRRPSVYTPNTSYSKQQQSKPSPTPPSSSSTSTTTSSTKPSSGGVGKDFLAVALSFHAAQQEEKASKQQQLNNNNNNALTLNKNAAPHLSPQPAVAPTQEDLNKSAVPTKKARLDSGTTNTTPKPLISPTSKSSSSKQQTTMPTTTTPGNNKKVFTMTIPTALQQLSSTLKKAKRKLAEAEKEDEPDVKILGVEVVSLSSSSVEATAVLGGRVCSVAESLKVATTSVSSSILIPGGVVPKGEIVDMCLWRGCCAEVGYNLLEHIQTVHVGSQSKGEVGFVCLWEGCKVFNRKSSSRSWLERHVLYHSGNKPFKCIFPGCGQSFGVQGALERHVNSHMASNCGGALSLAAANRNKIDANSPFKGVGRRKKQRCRKQRLNLGQHVDYFDKRVMELIKHRLASSISSHTTSAHHCTFRGQVLAKRRVAGEEAQLLVQWFPASIIPDEWVPLKEFHPEKTVPLTSLPKDKLPLVFPSLFPTQHIATDKARRKWCPSSSSSLDNGDDDEENEDSDEKVTKTTASLLLLPDEEVNSSVKTSPSSSSSSGSSSSLISSNSSTSQQKVSSKHNNKTAAAVSSSSSSSPSLCSDEDGDEDGDDWALDALLDNLFLTTVSSSSPPSS
ncbi:zinc finger protein jing homolog isoform X2 [Folsomia candida]|uniref:zinc finger protein jing homolog isoform X2 n=1 Tax=Folsomia candida TaxID=158441 RepID=UPI0016053260|nr:zinc finger protein jing homolog isoform X2 [Folsomia candida]